MFLKIKYSDLKILEVADLVTKLVTLLLTKDQIVFKSVADQKIHGQEYALIVDYLMVHLVFAVILVALDAAHEERFLFFKLRHHL